jgi:hypothetical protein
VIIFLFKPTFHQPSLYPGLLVQKKFNTFFAKKMGLIFNGRLHPLIFGDENLNLFCCHPSPKCDVNSMMDVTSQVTTQCPQRTMSTCDDDVMLHLPKVILLITTLHCINDDMGFVTELGHSSAWEISFCFSVLHTIL